MSLDRRLQRLERAEEQRLAAAVAAFGAYWWRRMADPATTARREAALAAAGYTGASIEEFRRWIAGAWTPARRAESAAFLAAIDAVIGHPADGVAVRAGLAAVASYLGLGPAAAPLVILDSLRARIAAEDADQEAS